MNVSEELQRLGDLHAAGKLSDAEFAQAKARVLSGAPAAAPHVPLNDAVNQLRRSQSDRWIGGVCGGIARSTGVQAWVWRLLFTLFALFAGGGLLVYVLLWIFVPEE